MLSVNGFSLISCLFSFDFLIHVIVCAMGVKHHSPLGGKRCLGEGLVGFPHVVEETLPCVKRILL